MALLPSASEAGLANAGVASRLAVVIDQLIALVAASGGATSQTPANGDAMAVAVGGTAVNAILGPVKGGYVENPLSATDQGIGAAEDLFVCLTGVASSILGNGGTSRIAPGQTYYLPSNLPLGVNVSVNAVSNGHKFNAIKYT